MKHALVCISALCWSIPCLDAGDAKKPNSARAQTGDKARWKSLFDGKSLAGWKSAPFGGEGEVYVKDGAIIMEQGNMMTGVVYTGKDLPTIDYEITLEGKRLAGNDFFCTTTFPVGKDFCSFVVGGWGGTVVGLSSLNGRDASENETGAYHVFKSGQWYRIRVRVRQNRIESWIDEKKVVDADTKDRKISVRAECLVCRPFGIATWCTRGAARKILIRPLTEKEKAEK
jgi:3-keto-disaccharide hydrolase